MGSQLHRRSWRRKLKRGFLDASANVDFVGWNPSPFGYNHVLTLKSSSSGELLVWIPSDDWEMYERYPSRRMLSGIRDSV
jgi:hypothetical protein